AVDHGQAEPAADVGPGGRIVQRLGAAAEAAEDGGAADQSLQAPVAAAVAGGPTQVLGPQDLVAPLGVAARDQQPAAADHAGAHPRAHRVIDDGTESPPGSEMGL